MIAADIKAVNLLDYYVQLYHAQWQAHTPDYMLVHYEILKHLVNCASYTEFGVNQGTTLAIPLLAGIKKIRAYDISLSPYNKARAHFEDFANSNKVDYQVFEADALLCDIEPVDMLYIDTVHRYEHLSKELNTHGDKAQKYIVFHDTFKPDKRMKDAVREFISTRPAWKVITECDKSVGFMAIAKDT
jgi:hypothetical protein